MKTQSKQIIEAARDYYLAKKQVKELEKKIKIFKIVIEKKLDGEGVLEAGDRTIVRTEAQRSSLDKRSLIQTFGEEAIKEHEKITIYFKLEVK